MIGKAPPKPTTILPAKNAQWLSYLKTSIRVPRMMNTQPNMAGRLRPNLSLEMEAGINPTRSRLSADGMMITK